MAFGHDGIRRARLQAKPSGPASTSDSQFTAISANMGTITGGASELGPGGTNRLQVSGSGIRGSNDSGSTWYSIISIVSGEVVANTDRIEACILEAGRISSATLAGITATFFLVGPSVHNEKLQIRSTSLLGEAEADVRRCVTEACLEWASGTWSAKGKAPSGSSQNRETHFRLPKVLMLVENTGLPIRLKQFQDLVVQALGAAGDD